MTASERALYVGERGIGRTTLLAALRDRAAARGIVVRSAAAVPAERDVPYALLDQLRPAGAELLIIDDLQWADPASLATLAELLDGPTGMIAAAYRPCPGLPLPVTEVRPVADARLLLRRRYPELAPPVVTRLVRAARGNPLALIELAAGLDTAQRSARRALPEVLPLGERGRAVFAPAVESLPAATRRRLVEAALTGADELDLDAGELAPAVRGGLLAGHPPRFAHPLVAPTVVALATAGERRTAHRALSRSARISPDRADLHLAACTTAADAALADRLERAAHRAWSRGEALRAAPILLRAAELSTDEAAAARRVALAAQVHAELTGQGARPGPASIEPLGEEPNPLRTVRAARAAVLSDRLGEHRAGLRRVARTGAQGGAVLPAVEAQALLALDDFGRGRWGLAALRTQQARQLTRARAARADLDPVRYVEALLAAAHGHDDTAQSAVDELLTSAAVGDSPKVAHLARHAAALAALGRADFETAYRHARAVTAPGVLSAGDLGALWCAPILIEAAVRTGRRPEAGRHAAALARVAPGSARFAMITAGGRAMTAPTDEALTILHSAVSVPGLRRWPFELARLNLRYGETLRRAREIARSRWHLQRALADFQRLGAAPWADRAAGELAAAGLTGVAGPVGALTPQEREIAELAATGLTNKQIAARLLISPRTVGAHLRRSFDKLGIGSRAALRDALSLR